jgi:hypothetical protein
MRTRHPTNTRPNGRPCLARAAVAGGNPQYAPLSLPEPWRYAARQDPVEGAISSRTYTVRTVRGDDLRAIIFQDTFADPFFVTVSAPALLVRPVRARLGFRSIGAPVSPDDMRLAWVLLRRGEEVGASFPALAHAHFFLRGLWVLA